MVFRSLGSPPVDADQAVTSALPDRWFSWTPDDVVRYHLAIGAGGQRDHGQLRYVLARELRVLPTFALTAPSAFGVAASPLRAPDPPEIRHPGLVLDLACLVQTAVDLVVDRPLPIAGSALARARILEVADTGRDAVLRQEMELVDGQGQRLCLLRSAMTARGRGGFGGRRPKPVTSGFTGVDGPPDLDLTTPTLPQQALLYQLCGEDNPVHVDPDLAAAAGFAAPTLQGVCTVGIVARAIVDAALDTRPEQVARLAVRLAGVVHPGDTLRTQVWRRADRLLFLTATTERPEWPVLTHGVVTLR